MREIIFGGKAEVNNQDLLRVKIETETFLAFIVGRIFFSNKFGKWNSSKSLLKSF